MSRRFTQAMAEGVTSDTCYEAFLLHAVLLLRQLTPVLFRYCCDRIQIVTLGVHFTITSDHETVKRD